MATMLLLSCPNTVKVGRKYESGISTAGKSSAKAIVLSIIFNFRVFDQSHMTKRGSRFGCGSEDPLQRGSETGCARGLALHIFGDRSPH